MQGRADHASSETLNLESVDSARVCRLPGRGDARTDHPERREKSENLGEDIAIKCKISTIDAFSAHADRDGLIDWLKYLKTPPEMVFIVHGEPKPQETFSGTIHQTLGFQTYIPKLNQVFDLLNLQAAAGKTAFAPMPCRSPRMYAKSPPAQTLTATSDVRPFRTISAISRNGS